ncbi:hypothetical protein MSSD14B_28900 [Marinobacter salsuginis]|uniref:Uncharacterized protein n=2 Tax=Marinobacter salsuginis TaxID=418719 RepID=A0A5M3Q273_9GAMM|nr:hypothetical protein MSSD14B_28900 [Marinobacter salsuginis]
MIVMRNGGVPFHNLAEMDWAELGDNIRNLLTASQPDISDSVTVEVFDDSLESATKPTLSENDQFMYMRELVSRAKHGNFKAHDLRNSRWVTTYTKSAPPQTFNGVITVHDDGSADILEAALDGMVEHFFSRAPQPSGLGVMPALFSGSLSSSARLSEKMLTLFCETFGNPFANDVTVMMLNDAQQTKFINAKNFMEFTS